MKKLIALSIISLITISHVASKSLTFCASSNEYTDIFFLTPVDVKPGNALVNFTIKKACKGTLVVVDEFGVTVLKQQVILIAGKNKITIQNISRLNEGNYTFCLNTNYKTYSTTFVLWK